MFQSIVGRLPEAAAIDVFEGDTALRFVVDLPGVTAETLTVRGEHHRLQIEARRAKPYEADEEYVREERGLYLDTTLPVPPAFDPTAASAHLADGVLTVTVPERTPTAVAVEA